MRETRRGREAEATTPNAAGAWTVSPVLAELTKLHEKVDRSLEQGRENSVDLKILRKELGIDGPHGRLPIVETAQADHQRRLARLERERIESGARRRLMTAAASFLSGGVGGTAIAMIAKVFHF